MLSTTHLPFSPIRTRQAQEEITLSGRLHAVGTLCTSILAVLALLSGPSTAHAYPIRTHTPWAILLCQFTDSPTPVHDPAYFADMFINRGTGGVADYWSDVSFGNIDFAGSVVKGWYTIPLTTAQETAKERWPRYSDCVDAAKNSPTDPYTVPSGYRTIVINSPPVDEWGSSGVAYLFETIDVTGSAHEMGHAFAMQHSYSDDPNYRNIWWSGIGEYDDEWDLMSAANVFTTGTARFGSAPPGLNGFHLDRAGWLPIARTYTFGKDGATAATVTLAAVNHPEAEGSLLVRVPFDINDLFHYYTVELRSGDGWDAGLPGGGGVMIHEVKLIEDKTYRSFLLRNHTGNREPLTSLSCGGVTITVDSVNIKAHQATVTITGDIATQCVKGYEFRDAFWGDRVCVPQATRIQVATDNAAAESRKDPNGGQFGPDTCLQGFVWREASPDDHVCVTPEIRTQTAADNAAASGRFNPSQYVFGPTTCIDGYVWREADNSDHVCVTPDIRSQAAEDNAAAPSRRNPNGGPFGPDTCIDGYVWREAFLGDHVCVLPETRTQAAADNAAAGDRVAHP